MAIPNPPSADPARRPPLMTMDEYFAFEEASPIRHEFVGGEVFAMTGVSRRHSRIAMNVGARVWAAARGSTCRVHQSEVKVRLRDRVYYPDVMVACGPEPVDQRYENAPCLLVEVLSRSTWRTDRREKLPAYQGTASLDAYLVIEQERRLVDRYWRTSPRTWRRETLVDAGTIELPCPALTLTLDEIYEGVELPPLDEVMRVYEAAAAEYR